jgi:D-2-hydroxyacid dehydrogenase (NADP+)
MRVLIYLAHEVPAFSPTAAQIARLRAALPQHRLIFCAERSDFLEALPSAGAAVVWRFEAGWYACAPRLRMVLTPAAGRELIAPDPAGKVTRTFGTFHGPIMAESLLAMIGFVNRRFGSALAAQARGVWDREPYVTTRRLATQTVLLVGYGRIARHCAALLKGVGATVHALKRDVRSGTEGADRVFAGDDLLEAVEGADHIVCILPRDTGTDAFVGAAALARMKSTAAVYNLGRGNAIDTAALRQALLAGRLAAAFLDVVPEEPLPPDSELWATPDLFISPHVSALTADYLDLFFDELAARLRPGVDSVANFEMRPSK